MKPCFGGLILSTLIIIFTFFWWPAEWVKWTVIGLAGLIIVMSLFMQQICDSQFSSYKQSDTES